MQPRIHILYAGEKVVLVVRPHPIVLAKHFILPLIGVTIFAAYPHVVTAAVCAVMSAKFVWIFFNWWHDQYVLTNNRMISLSGIVNRRTVSIPLGKITDSSYMRTLSGRIFNYGLLNLESAGQAGLEKIDYLPSPDVFYRAVMALATGAADGTV